MSASTLGHLAKVRIDLDDTRRALTAAHYETTGAATIMAIEALLRAVSTITLVLEDQEPPMYGSRQESGVSEASRLTGQPVESAEGVRTPSDASVYPDIGCGDPTHMVPHAEPFAGKTIDAWLP